MKTKSLYANSTLQKIDKLDRLTVQVQNAQDEIDRLKAAIKADLSVLKAENLIPAYDAALMLFKAARDGNLMKSDTTECCQKCQEWINGRCYLSGPNAFNARQIGPWGWCQGYNAKVDVNSY